MDRRFLVRDRCFMSRNNHFLIFTFGPSGNMSILRHSCSFLTPKGRVYFVLIGAKGECWFLASGDGKSSSKSACKDLCKLCQNLLLFAWYNRSIISQSRGPKANQINRSHSRGKSSEIIHHELTRLSCVASHM